jgi:hypothetical protein
MIPLHVLRCTCDRSLSSFRFLRTCHLLKSRQCLPSMISSLLHTHGSRRTSVPVTCTARSTPATGHLSVSTVTRTGVSQQEGAVHVPLAVCLCIVSSFMFDFGIVLIKHLYSSPCSSYDDLHCRNVTQWFESNDVVVVCFLNIFTPLFWSC